jgi:hypothetical protein
MSSDCEAGWAAFQRGDIEEAIRQLSSACAESPFDYDAHLYLGLAYGRARRHADAIAAITAAVHLQPANAQARYNLGVALEQGGYGEQAIEAYRQAATLDPTYTRAVEAVRRLGGIAPAGAGAAAPSAPAPFHAPPPDSPADATLAFPSTPAASSYGAAPTVQWQPAPDAAAPGFEAAGQPARGGALPDHGLMHQYAPSPNAPAGPTTAFSPYSSEMPPPNFNDEMDVPGTFRDFGRIIVTPGKFFRDQVGRNGLMSPILMVGLYLIIQLAVSLVTSGAQGVVTLVASLIFSPISLAITGAWMVALYLVSALVIHFLGWLFGNRQDFSVSFRACVFADAPRFVMAALVSLYMAFFVLPSFTAKPFTPADLDEALGLPPGTTASGYPTNTPQPGGVPSVTRGGRRRGTTTRTRPTVMPQPTPEVFFRLFSVMWRRVGAIFAVSVAFSLIGWAWSTVLLVLAIHRLQQISPGAAIGVVFLMYALLALIILLLVFGFAGLIFALINSAVHSGAAAGAVGMGR